MGAWELERKGWARKIANVSAMKSQIRFCRPRDTGGDTDEGMEN
jgi:hypothetical protein